MDWQVWGIRVRSIIDEYIGALFVVAVVLAVLGGHLTVSAYAQTHTETETEQVSAWNSSGGFTHAATVATDTAVFDRGERLENRRRYLGKIMPRLEGSFVYTYTATDSGDLAADVRIVRVLRSVPEEGNATEYWRTESTLERQTVESLAPGESVRVPFSTNVSGARQRLAAIDEQVGGTPGETELFFEARLALSGTRNGQPVETRRSYRLPISQSGNVYGVEDPGTVTDAGQQRRQVTVAVDPGPVRAYGGPLLLGIVLVALCGFVLGRYGDYLSVFESERVWLTYYNTRQEFDDWITVVRLPDGDRPSSVVEVDSLEGLVDIAIDTDRRVLEDRDSDLFFVFGEHRTYAYLAPTLPGERGPFPPNPSGIGVGSLLAVGTSDGQSTDESDQTDGENPG